MHQDSPNRPITITLKVSSALVIGGGSTCERLVLMLVDKGLQPTLLCDNLSRSLQDLVSRNAIRLAGGLHDTAQCIQQVQQASLIFLTNTQRISLGPIVDAAHKANVPIWVENDPNNSTFSVLEDHDRSSSHPQLTDQRDLLKALSPFSRLRNWAKPAAGDGAVRHDRAPANEADSPHTWCSPASRGDVCLTPPSAAQSGNIAKRGQIWLVGAGPGDPNLLTLEAITRIKLADSILYDQLVSPSILALAPETTPRICVGKMRAHHMMPQDDINAELVRRARQGEHVLRLKGGDPFIFGRGGEEMLHAQRAGIPVHIVPGISAANGCAAAAGIPLTHRDCAQICIFITGHGREGGLPNLEWPLLARRGQTLVVFMGLSGLPHLCETLRKHGLPDEWPSALIAHGTRPSQRVIVSTLACLPQRVAREQLKSPSLIIVGEVVNFRSNDGSG